MEMMVGTVSVSQAPTQQGTAASSSGTDFSEILSGVRQQTGTVKQPDTVKQQDTVKQPDTAARQDSAAQNTAGVVDNAVSSAAEGEYISAAGEGYEQQPGQGQETTVTAEVKAAFAGVYGAELKSSIEKLVIKLSGGDKDEEDKIIQMLLDYLKKLQNGDETTDLAMQLLMSMLGGQQQPTAEIYLSVQNVSAEVTAVSAGYASMSVSVGETVQPQQEVPQAQVNITPDGQSDLAQTAGEEEQKDTAQTLSQGRQDTAQMTSQNRQEAPQRAEAPAKQDTAVQTAVQKEQEVQKTTEIPVIPEAPVIEQEAETAQTPVMREAAEIPQASVNETVEGAKIPQDEAFAMLEDILGKAREELGLEKAQFTVSSYEVRETAQDQPSGIRRAEIPARSEKAEQPEQAERTDSTEQTERPEQFVRNTRASGLELKPNHRDGRSELSSILETDEKKPADEEKPRVNEQQGVQTAVPANNRPVTAAAPIREERPRIFEIPPERQLADEILSRSETAEGGRTEFTMVLNPESLGRITVKLASTGGRIEVSITAENDSTRQLLQSRTEQLSSALRSSGVDLERYQVVTGHEEAQLMQDNYDGSGKNPYGRQQEENADDSEESGNDFLEILQQI